MKIDPEDDLSLRIGAAEKSRVRISSTVQDVFGDEPDQTLVHLLVVPRPRREYLVITMQCELSCELVKVAQIADDEPVIVPSKRPLRQ